MAPTVTTVWLVSGNTYVIKDELKAAGATFIPKPTTAWLVPEDGRVAAQAAADGVGASVTTGVLLTGTSYSMRDDIKAIGGGVWVQPWTAWFFPESKRAAVVAFATGAPTADGNEHMDDGSTSPRGKDAAAVSPTVSAASSPAKSPAISPAKVATSPRTAPLYTDIYLNMQPHENSVVFTGDTLKAKDRLKALGGSWNPTLKGWVFPASAAREVQAELTKVGIVVNTDAGPVSSPDSESGAAALPMFSGAVLEMHRDKSSVVFTGDTLLVKEVLKALGGSWNKMLLGWVFPESKASDVVASLRRSGITVNGAGRTQVGAATGAAAAAAAPPEPFVDSGARPNVGKDIDTPYSILSFCGARVVLERFGGGELIQIPGQRHLLDGDFYDDGDCNIPYMPKLSVEASRTRTNAKATEPFVCQGTMYRHTAPALSWTECPVEFKSEHKVSASKESPVRVVLHEEYIEDLTPFDCDYYWRPAWQKCWDCHQHDLDFARWAKWRSISGAEDRKRKAADPTSLAAAGSKNSQGSADASASGASASASPPKVAKF